MSGVLYLLLGAIVSGVFWFLSKDPRPKIVIKPSNEGGRCLRK